MLTLPFSREGAAGAECKQKHFLVLLLDVTKAPHPSFLVLLQFLSDYIIIVFFT